MARRHSSSTRGAARVHGSEQELSSNRIPRHTWGAEGPLASMTPFTRSTRTLHPSAVLGIAVALFAVILALKLAVRAPGFGFPLLYDIPVALVAVALGLRAGLATAGFAMVLYAIRDAVAEIHSNAAGYASPSLT